MINILKKIILKIFYGNKITRKNVKFGKGSYIRGHAHIRGGKHIFLGNNTRISHYSRIMCWDKISNVKLNPSLNIGNNVFIGRNITISCANKIVIEDDVLIAGYCFICDSNHGINPELGVRYEKQPLDVSYVIIKNNVWLGDKVMVMPGVVIGENSVIGAGSVVTKDIPPYSIAVGNPARVIKQYNFDSHSWERVKQ